MDLGAGGERGNYHSGLRTHLGRRGRRRRRQRRGQAPNKQVALSPGRSHAGVALLNGGAGGGGRVFFSNCIFSTGVRMYRYALLTADSHLCHFRQALQPLAAFHQRFRPFAGLRRRDESRELEEGALEALVGPQKERTDLVVDAAGRVKTVGGGTLAALLQKSA